MSDEQDKPVRPIYRRLRMKSTELCAMYDAGKGTLRDVCRVLSSASDNRAFAALMALDETILFRTAERRQKERDRLVNGCRAITDAVREFEARRDALMEQYAERGEDGHKVIDIGEDGVGRIRVPKDRLDDYAKAEAALCDAQVAILNNILCPTSVEFPWELADFDKTVVAVNLCVFPWHSVPKSVGGGMLLAALPLFEGVPSDVVREAERFRDREESQGADLADRMLAWQGIRRATDANPGELVEGPAAMPTPSETAPVPADE